jgi:hypothetical protein
MRPDTPTFYVWTPHRVPLERWTLRREWLEELHVDPHGITYAQPHVGPEPHPAVIEAAGSVPFVAHNAWGFDEHVWDAQGLPPAEWIDSIVLCRRAGLPSALEQVGQALYSRGKDRQGSSTLQLLCKPRKDGKFVPVTSDRLSAIVRYCLKDVLLMACAVMDEDLDAPHVDDPVLAAHYEIDRRGVRVDLPLAALLLSVDRAAVDAAVDACELPAETLRSSVALLRWLRAQGCEIEDVQAPTLRGLL